MRNIVIASALLLATSAQSAPTARLTGDWVMDLYIGDQVFADEVSVRPGTGGGSGGSLTVPGRFTSPLENIVEQGDGFSFDITADEGRGPFRVHYDGRFHGADDVFVGFATMQSVGSNKAPSLLGGFVGRRKAPTPTP